MSVIDDIAWMEREIAALKGFSAPNLNLLIQKTYSYPASSNLDSRIVSIRWIDNTRHMIWAMPSGVQYLTLSSMSGDGLARYRYVPKPNQPVTIIFSSFDDFRVV